MPREIPKAYEPQEIEERWAKSWFDEKLFRAENSGDGPVFSIALPPPNITGSIHIGHMLEHTQIDMLVRWHRMRGHRTLWLPGMDHAGIATQFVVERQLAKEKIRRQDLGREEFERRVWQWKDGKRRRDQGADDPPRRFLRLDARTLHARAGALSRGDRSFPAALSRGPDLSRPLHRQLVPALPDGHQRSRSRPRRAPGQTLASALSRRRLQRISCRRHHAPRNHAGRHRRRRASGRRALPAFRRQDTSCCR